MSRSWLVTCGILVLVLLPIPGYGNLYITAKDAEFEYIKSIPLPTGYEEYSWVSAGDMAYLRNTTIPRIDYAWTGYIWAFDAIVAMMLGVPAAVAVPAAAATASPWKEALSSLIVNGVEDLGLSWGVKEELLKIDTARFREIMRKLRDDSYSQLPTVEEEEFSQVPPPQWAC